MLTLEKPARARKQQRSQPARKAGYELIRISEEGFPIGDVLLDGLERVLKHDGRIPRDVVLKALVLYTRCGQLVGEAASRENGRTYAWDVIDEDEW
jgi:hypothetical protein